MSASALLTLLGTAVLLMMQPQPATVLVEGRVITEDGQPAARASVTLEHPWRPGTGPRALTDERGAFSIPVARPGRFRVCAAPTPDLAHRTAEQFPSELPIRTCHSRQSGTLEGDVLSIETAALTGIEIRLRRSRAYSVAGSTLDAAGAPFEANWFTITQRDGIQVYPNTRRNGDRFALRGVAPGEYIITAGRRAEDGRLLERGTTVVRVGDADVESVVVRTAVPTRIVGRVEFAEGRPTTMPIINVNTVGERQRPVGPYSNHSRVTQDLTFQIDGLFGPQMLQVYGTMAPWTVQAIQYRGEDIYGKSVDVTASSDPDDLIVVLTNRSASVTATLRRPADALAMGAMVALVPLDPRTGAPLETAALRPIDATGPFGLPRVRPGDYLIAAVAKEDTQMPLKALTPHLIPRATRITLGPNEHRQIELDIVRPE